MSDEISQRGEIKSKFKDEELILNPSFGNIAKAGAILGNDWPKLAKELTQGSLKISLAEAGLLLEIIVKKPSRKSQDWAEIIKKRGMMAFMNPVADFVKYMVMGEEGLEEEAKEEAEGNSSAKETPDP